MTRVVVLGGGVAGMSAAHELVHRGIDVEVFELKTIPGGKARSIPVAGTGTGGRKDLPGEHGFRFFPGFYKHIIDTMARIPLDNGKTVLDNLVDTTQIEMARYGLKPLQTPTNFFKSLAGIVQFLDDLCDIDGHGIPVSAGEKAYFAERVWQIMTSCQDRRMHEYEKIDWWDFIGADKRSADYQKYFGYGLTRTLVATQPRTASTKTGGDILVQLLIDMASTNANTDRVLNGPTNEAWIDPWLRCLRSQGAIYNEGWSVVSINCTPDGVQGAVVTDGSSTKTVQGDYYIAALPVEAMAKLVAPEMVELDPSLGNLASLASHVGWMNGMQFFLKRDVPISKGHVIYVDSSLAATSISQKQFWPGVDLADYGDGSVRGVLSVDISDWNAIDPDNNLSARQMTREQLKDAVWTQLKRSLNTAGQVLLQDDDVAAWALDSDIVYGSAQASSQSALPIENKEPLLVNEANTWRLRPTAFTRIRNLMLASDYIQTYTDLATMEGANEAARRAVNAILDASGSDQPHCLIWNLHEPDILAPLRLYDEVRYKMGLPWKL